MVDNWDFSTRDVVPRPQECQIARFLFNTKKFEFSSLRRGESKFRHAERVSADLISALTMDVDKLLTLLCAFWGGGYKSAFRIPISSLFG